MRTVDELRRAALSQREQELLVVGSAYFSFYVGDFHAFVVSPDEYTELLKTHDLGDPPRFMGFHLVMA